MARASSPALLLAAWFLSMGLVVMLTVELKNAHRQAEPVKVQVLLYPHVDHECMVEVYSDDTWVWTCDDGCYYMGTWQPDIENFLTCPEDGSNEY